jgi:hypothetical protein
MTVTALLPVPKRMNLKDVCYSTFQHIFRASFKFFMGDKVREKMEGGRRVETLFSALYCANTFTNCILKQLKIVGRLSKMKPCTRRGPKIGKKR